MNYRIAIFLVMILTLTGCAQTGMSPEGEKAYFKAQQAAAAEPLMELKCPATGCKVASLTVNNPTDNSVQAPEVRTPVVEALSIGANVATTVAPWAAVGTVAVEGVKAAQGDTETRKRRDTYGDDSEVVGSDKVGDNSGVKSGNSGRIDSDSTNNSGREQNSGRIDSPNEDATSEPTVVQPEEQ